MTRQSGILLVPFLLQMAACATAPPPAAPKEAPEPVVEAVVESEPVVTPKAPPPGPDKSQIRFSVAAVGDMMLGTDYPQNHLPDDDGVSFLEDVSAIISDADIGFGNLEGVLLDGGEPGKKCSNPAACYLFRSPTRYADHYKAAGFDILSLANNHARDFAEDGRTSSMRAIAARNMHHSGREGDFASFTVNDLEVAFLAYAVTQGSNLLHDYKLAFETVAEYARNHDIVVVSFHGGAEGADAMHVPFAEEEYYGEPRGDVVRFARGVVDAGADLVIGHGPHVVRGMERYKNRLIAYSLGNFATYYGISVAGVKGVAPIVTATMDGDGNFLNGTIVSTVQLRPAGPSIDQQQRALNWIRDLSMNDFGTPGLHFHDDGRILPAHRNKVKQHPLVVSPDRFEVDAE